jgi:hypothetical protein
VELIERLAQALGADRGGNLTLIGASAGLVVASLAGRSKHNMRIMYDYPHLITDELSGYRNTLGGDKTDCGRQKSRWSCQAP